MKSKTKKILIWSIVALLFIIGVIISAIIWAQHSNGENTPSVPDVPEAPLTIHLIPHSHDDVGWLKSTDDYYYGRRQDIQNANVQSILETVFTELKKNPSRRFTQVEMKFFTMWYYSKSEADREVVKQLVKEGRLDIVNGGWSMHDEACPTYDDMITNMMKGH